MNEERVVLKHFLSSRGLNFRKVETVLLKNEAKTTYSTILKVDDPNDDMNSKEFVSDWKSLWNSRLDFTGKEGKAPESPIVEIPEDVFELSVDEQRLLQEKCSVTEAIMKALSLVGEESTCDQLDDDSEIHQFGQLDEEAPSHYIIEILEISLEEPQVNVQ